MQILRPAQDKALLDSDISGLGPAAYWITNPNNTFTNNVATSVRGTGFWVALPVNPTGAFAHRFPDAAALIFPRRTPLGIFSGNSAHAIVADGLHVDQGPMATGTGVETANYQPRTDPANAGSAPVTAVFQDFVAWKTNGASIWLRGDHLTVQGGILADHSRGLTMASSSATADDVVFIGETANSGTPTTPLEITTGRSMPRTNTDTASNNLNGFAFPIFGFAFYDGDVHISDSAFYGYQQNSNRYASALGVHDWTNFNYSPYNDATNLHFGPNTLRYWRSPIPPNKTGSQDGFRTATILDTDGTLTGTAGAIVVPADNQLLAPGATARNDWNAAIRTDLSIAQLVISNQDTTVVAPLQQITLTAAQNRQYTFSSSGTTAGSSGPGNSPAASIPAYDEDYRITYSGTFSSRMQVRLGAYPRAFVSTNMNSRRPVVTLRIDYPNTFGAPTLLRDGQTMPLDPASSLTAFNAQTGSDDQLYFRDTTTGILYIRLCTRTASSTALRSSASVVIVSA